MAKVKSPLMSQTASGLIGERLVFSERSSCHQVRIQKAQKDVLTNSRNIQREKYRVCALDYFSLDPVVKQFISTLTPGKKYTGYNLFMKNCLNGNTVGSDLSLYGVRVYGKYKYGQMI